MSAPMRRICRQSTNVLHVSRKMASDLAAAENDVSKRSLKRKRAMGHYKKKQYKTHEPNEESGYYFENGLRKVYPYTFHFTTYVKERWIGRTLLDTFSSEFIQNPKEKVQLEIENGNIRVNGEKVSPNFILKNNQLISHRCHRHECPVLDTPISILVDTPDILVINKPASIPCHPCGRYRYNTLLQILEKEYGYTNLRTLHRLDRLTSGLLIYPKTTKVSKKLETQLEKQLLQKEYVCRVFGEFPEGEITCDQPIGLLARTVSLYGVTLDGKPSITKFTKLSYNGKSSVVKCVPVTGRTHQIRVHLQYLGHPIVNDPLYNNAAFGPGKGKGGVRDRPIDEIEKLIMGSSNVGTWVIGKNPDYIGKFGEDGLKPCSNDIISVAEPVKDSVSSGVNSVTEYKIDDVSERSIDSTTIGVNLDLENDDSRLSKAAADGVSLSNNISTCSIANESKSQGVDCVNTLDSDNEEKERKRPKVDCDKAKDTSDLPQDGQASDAVDESKSKETSSVERMVPDQTETRKAPERHGLDRTKLTVSRNCSNCKKLYADPMPKDLIIYLHAVRYKGPDWEYSTELPYWAHEDFSDEDIRDDVKILEQIGSQS